LLSRSADQEDDLTALRATRKMACDPILLARTERLFYEGIQQLGRRMGFTDGLPRQQLTRRFGKFSAHPSSPLFSL
jgi:hypothetical protein